MKQNCDLKVFYRFALLLKMQHALNMCICFSLPLIRTVEFRPIKSLMLTEKGLFSMAILKTYRITFSYEFTDLY